MSEVYEMRIVPSRDIQAVAYFKYRGTDRKLWEFLRLQIDGIDYYIKKKQIPQLFKYLDIGYMETRGIYDYDKRNEKLRKALQRCDKELFFSIADDRIIRIVSSDFTAIPHSKVLQIVEKELRLDYEDREVEFDGGMFAKWTLRSLPKDCAKLGDIVSWNLWAYNYNVGNRALRIGGGFTVLACQNGAVGWKSAAKVRLIHRGAYEDLISKIELAVHELYNNTLPTIAYQIQEAQRVKAVKVQLEKLIRLYPQWIQDELREQLRKAHTIWDVSNAFSYVATHKPVTFNQRMQLSNHAVEVLSLVERR